MFQILVAVLLVYLMYGCVFILLKPEIANFIKYEMPDEIASIKKEFNITNKVFDYLTIAIFLISLPVTKWEGY
jgi:hypothetical protein